MHALTDKETMTHASATFKGKIMKADKLTDSPFLERERY